MEKYVCSLELAKRLKELGVKQESEFYWVVNKMKNVSDKIIPFKEKKEEYEYKDFSQHYYSAFTVGESGEMVPSEIIKGKKEKDRYNLRIYKFDDSWLVEYANHEGYILKDGEYREENLANALAKMRIYLLENKLIN